MSGFVDRENEIFEVLQEFVDAGLDFVVVGGYGVSAFQHRFSVDADLVLREGDLDRFTEILQGRGFEEVEDRELDVYGGRYLAYQKDEELPVTIDLLVNSLRCRQTDASWSYDYFQDHSTTAEIEGSEKSVTVRVPEAELLAAVKLHSGRLTDARDVVALSSEIDFDQVEQHMDRGDSERLDEVLEDVFETISGENFEDSFKGVFSQKELPSQQIEALRDFIQEQLEEVD
jgi:hypothetical protein